MATNRTTQENLETIHIQYGATRMRLGDKQTPSPTNRTSIILKSDRWAEVIIIIGGRGCGCPNANTPLQSLRLTSAPVRLLDKYSRLVWMARRIIIHSRGSLFSRGNYGLIVNAWLLRGWFPRRECGARPGIQSRMPSGWLRYRYPIFSVYLAALHRSACLAHIKDTSGWDTKEDARSQYKSRSIGSPKRCTFVAQWWINKCNIGLRCRTTMDRTFCS